MALARVQATGKVTADAATSISLTFATPPTVGNAVVVPLFIYSSTSAVPLAIACTDNQGNTYFRAGAVNNAGPQAVVFYCPKVVATGAPFTLTITPIVLSAWYAVATAIEVSGVGTGGLYPDQLASNTGSSTTPATGATAALTVTEAFLVAVHDLAVSPTSSITVESVSPPWTQEAEELGTTHADGESDSRVVTGVLGTTVSCSWTDAPSAPWAALIVAFKATTLPSGFVLTAWGGMAPGIGSGTIPALNTTGVTLLVVSVAWYTGAGGVPVVSDSKGNTWVGLTAHAGGAGSHRFFYVLNPTVGAGHTITVTATVGNIYATSFVYGYSGVATPWFQGMESGAGLASGASPLASGSVTPPQNGSLVLTAMRADTAGVDSVTPAGFSQQTVEFNSGTGCQNSTAYVVQATAGAINPTWAWTGTHTLIAVSTAVFLPTPSASASARVSQDVVELLSQPLFPPTRVSQDVVELLSVPTTTPVRVSQDVIEILTAAPALTGNPSVTQLVAETLSHPAPAARTTQLVAEVLTSTTLPTTVGRVTQLVVETVTQQLVPPCVTQLVVETTTKVPPPPTRVSQSPVELVGQSVTEGRLSQAPVENVQRFAATLVEAHVSQSPVETVQRFTASLVEAHVSQAPLEILYPFGCYKVNCNDAVPFPVDDAGTGTACGGGAALPLD